MISGDRLIRAGADDAALNSMRPLTHSEIEELRLRAAVVLEQSRQTVRDRVRLTGPTDAAPRLWRGDELAAAQPREWLATGHVPRSAVTLLVGDEGIGKSLMWVWLIAFVTTGKPMPEYGVPVREPADVIVVATEDDWATTVRPRLEVAGVDLSRVHVIASEADGSGAPTFPDDLDVILTAEVDPALVVVDAWLDTVPAKLSVRDPQHARQALHPWKEYATSSGAAVLLLTHTNRVATANARDKYGATAELRKKARMTLFAQADPDEEGCVVIGPEKSNIARSSDATRFRITSIQHFPPTADDDGTVPLLAYAGTVGKSSRQIIADRFNEGDEDATTVDAAKAWLADYLSVHSPAASKQTKDAARKDENISERTLKRAASELGVIYHSEGFPRKTVWSLPGDQHRDPLAAPATEVER
ncbi:AAA family ATPase [Rhodococcus sp. BP-332]|nr:AAA family ATPase [Rhodococcus sp. BP-332]